MADQYASRRDVYRYGLPRGTLGSDGRVVHSASTSANTLELDGHGFETGDQVIMRAAEGGTLAAPLAAGVTYYTIRTSDSLFQLSLTDGGVAIDLTTTGSSMIVAIELPFDEVLEYYSRWVDDLCVGHVVPFELPIPLVIRATVAELAAKKLLQLAGHTSESANDFELAAKAKLERWAKGIPLRDAGATAPANLAVTTLVTATAADPRGWGTGGI